MPKKKIKKIASLSLKLFQTQLLWNLRFNKIYPDSDKKDPGKLGFVLGCGRSGTSWLGRTISETSTPIRYCHEILNYVNPTFYFSRKNDKTSVKYIKELDDNHPLVKIYEKTLIKQLDWNKFIPKKTEQLKRNDNDFEFVLHKEVHALLATEGLIRKFPESHFVLISRNPAYVIDSLFDYHKLSSNIWRNESRNIRNPEFVKRFLDNNKKILKKLKKYPDDGLNRKNTIIGKAITVGAINKMFYTLSKKYRNVFYVKYEDLCQNPIETFKNIYHFFGFNFGEKEKNKIIKTIKAKNEKYNPMSIYRDTKKQTKRNLKSLTREEFDKINKILKELSLSVNDY